MGGTAPAPRRLPWRSAVLIAVALVVVWSIFGGDILSSNAGYRSVAGAWRFDQAYAEATVLRPSTSATRSAADPVQQAHRIQRLKQEIQPFRGRTYTFTAESYWIDGATTDGTAIETACTYEGISPVMVRVIGAADGVEDDLTIMVTPQDGRMHLQTPDLAMPFARQ